MTREEKKEEIISESKKLKEEHPYFRWGQAVFNYIDFTYGLARTIQFVDKVDCFYDDKEVDEFVEKCLDKLDF